MDYLKLRLPPVSNDNSMEKICQSESGLSRHEKSNKRKYSVEDIFLLKSFIEKRASKLGEDACYPEDVFEYWNGSILGVNEVISPS